MLSNVQRGHFAQLRRWACIRFGRTACSWRTRRNELTGQKRWDEWVFRFGEWVFRFKEW